MEVKTNGGKDWNNETPKKRDVSRKVELLVGQVCVDVEKLRKALQPISEAQKMLEDNYPRWNEAGRKHAIASASKALRDAHNRISHIYAQAIDLPNHRI